MAVRPVVQREAKLLAHAQPEPAPSQPAAIGRSQAPGQERVAVLVDSLIDHAEDVDFVLDPVRVGRERTAGRPLRPARCAALRSACPRARRSCRFPRWEAPWPAPSAARSARDGDAVLHEQVLRLILVNIHGLELKATADPAV